MRITYKRTIHLFVVFLVLPKPNGGSFSMFSHMLNCYSFHQIVRINQFAKNIKVILKIGLKVLSIIILIGSVSIKAVLPGPQQHFKPNEINLSTADLCI